MSTTAAPPPPRSAGARYFAWLYSAEKVREGVSALLAIEREILASTSSGLDHPVAHARLAWWQDECARLRAAQPVHPASLAARDAFLAVGLPAPDLASLAELAAARLAYASLGREATSEASAQDAALWTHGLFLPLAALSGAAVGIDTGAAVEQLRALGIALCTHERTPGDATRAALRTALASLPGALRPALRALLVWSTLALRPAAPTPGAALADNWIAWRAARAAARALP